MDLNFPFPLDAAQPVPFTIAVNESFVRQTVRKAADYRPSADLLDDSNTNWLEGPPRANMTALAGHWATDYDWAAEQDRINGELSHFAVVVPETEAWPHAVPLHYVHELTENNDDDDDALPLLLLHGWPSTSLEWSEVIPHLVSPPDGSKGHDVVAVDLPGFGFSPAPQHAGFDPKTIAAVLDAFMTRLGYARYGVVSTDLGWWVGMWMTDVVPPSSGRLAGHFSDFFLVPPNATDLARYAANLTTPEETRMIASNQAWYDGHTGYQHVQTMQPLAVGQAFSDSPVGFAGWVWHILFSVSDQHPYTFDEIITTAFVLFVQGTWGNLRYYKELFNVSKPPPLFSCSFL